MKTRVSYGGMDKALVLETKDSRFDPLQDRFQIVILIYDIKNTKIKNYGVIMSIHLNRLEIMVLYPLCWLNAFIYDDDDVQVKEMGWFI